MPIGQSIPSIPPLYDYEITATMWAPAGIHAPKFGEKSLSRWPSHQVRPA
ncbi:hypothetical protein K2X85_13940 [bacterium]|jgi:hypothetical protein|nr:hypothetical protein [bacterium]